jgi:parallel beta-helix repeat protein
MSYSNKRKTRLLWLLSLFWLFAGLHADAQMIHKAYQDGVIHLKIKDESNFEIRTAESTGDAVLTKVFKQYLVYRVERPYRSLKTPRFDRWYRVYFSQPAQVDAFLKALSGNKLVELAEKVPLITSYQAAGQPNDPFAQPNASPGQYALTRINAWGAFALHQGNASVKIAIVDDAVQHNHADLTGNRWVNTAEQNGVAGVDDDGNGYVDDIHGYDVADNDPNPLPPAFASSTTFAHGTHCAGIAAARTNNAIGMASSGNSCSFISVKCTPDNAANPAQLPFAYDGVVYAIAAGADVISMSWGGTASGQVQYEIIARARSLGIILVAAAGNDNNSVPHYPAAYGSASTYTPVPLYPGIPHPMNDLVIAVASSDQNDQRSAFSCYGSWVDIMAPGSGIYSTVPFNAYSHKDGTSMAAPLVSGMMALASSFSPSSTPQQIISCVLSSANASVYNINQNMNFAGQLGSGRLEALLTLQCLCPPTNAVTNLQITGPANAPLPASFNLGSSFTFHASATLNGTPAYQWFVNNVLQGSTTSTLPFTFTTTGTHTISVRVSNSTNTNCAALETRTVNVVCPLNAAFTASSTQIQPGGMVTFTNTSAGNPAGTTYQWLRDGVPITMPANGAVTFPNAGRYSFTRIAENNFGGSLCSNQFSLSVNVGICSVPELEYNHWAFANNISLRFTNSGSSPLAGNQSVLAASPISGSFTEGVASISDRNTGGLLLQTDGATLFDGSGRVVTSNSLSIPPTQQVVNTLRGSTTSLQSAIILSHPDRINNPDIYYIITSAAINDQNVGINLYTIRANTTGASIIYGPLQLFSGNGTEGVSATRHCNERDYWISVIDINNENIVIFPISSTTPIFPTQNQILSGARTHSGLIDIDNSTHGRGMTYMKFSPSGNLLGVSLYISSELHVFNFDKSTGNITGNLVRYNASTINPYFNTSALEFSPNERFLYLVRKPQNNTHSLTQLDLTNLSLPAFTIATNLNFGGLQIGPDGRIYCPIKGTNNLSVINNPDLPGSLCTYNPTGIVFQGNTLEYGLPNVLTTTLDNSRAIIYGSTNVCISSDTLIYSGPRLCAGAAYSWSIASGPGRIADQSNSHQVKIIATGTGDIVLRLSFTSACGTDIKQVTIRINPPSQPVSINPSSSQICLPGTVVLNATPGFTNYLWNDYSTNQSFSQSLGAANRNNIYRVTATDISGCTSTATAVVTGVFGGAPTCNLPAIIQTCDNFNGITLDAGAGSRWLWDDQSTNQTRTVFSTGVYSVRITNICGGWTNCTTRVVTSNPTLSHSVSNSSCNQNNGSINATITGGTPPYIFSLPAPQNSANGNAIFSNLLAGTYTIRATDANNCTVEITNVRVINASNAIQITSVITPAGCLSATSLGSAAISITGGQPTFQVSINGGAAQAYQTNPFTLSSLAAGTYTISVTDEKGCKGQEKVTIGTTSFEVTATPAAPSCNGASDGTITLGKNVPAGTSVTITTQSGQPVPAAVISGSVITGLAAGSYIVTATNPDGCVRTFTVIVPATLVSCCAAAQTGSGYTRFTTRSQIDVTTSRAWGGKIYIPDGTTIKVSANVTLDITQADVVFGNCASIAFENGARLRANNSTFRSCNPFASWNGFTFRGAVTGTLSNCVFKNAQVALLFNSETGDAITDLRIEDNSFLNCGMAVRANRLVLNGSISGNNFQTDNAVINWCNNWRGYQQISLAGTKVNSAIANNTFVSYHQTETVTGIVMVGSDGGRVNGNRFTDMSTGILLSNCSNALVEQNTLLVSRKLPVSSTNAITGILCSNAKEIRIFGNELENLVWRTAEKTSISALSCQKSERVMYWGNTVRGYQYAANMQQSFSCAVVSNHFSYQGIAGMVITDSEQSRISCNEIKLEGNEKMMVTGIRIVETRTEPRDAQHSISSNCITGADTAISLLASDSKSGAPMPVIVNNYLYNYKQCGIYSLHMYGNLGTDATGMKAGRNTFATSWIKTIDVEYQPALNQPGTLNGEGNYFTHSNPILVNAVMGNLNTTASNAGCGHQLFTDDTTPPVYDGECLPEAR